MAASSQQSQATLLEHLQPKVLRKIVQICADDVAVGRATLLSLSVMNKYLRSVAVPRLFQRVRFRDNPESPGDEILHSIRRFVAAPELWFHARTLSLYLKRRNCLGADHATVTDPYHSLLLPELVAALVKMPKLTELLIQTDGTQGRKCVEGLQAAVRWGTAEGELNIKSLTIIPDTWSGYECQCEQPDSDHPLDFFAAFPKLKIFCFVATEGSWPQHTLNAGCYYHPTIASNLTQLRLYRSCSDPTRDTGFQPNAWRLSEISEFPNLSIIMPHLEYLSILGELRVFPVWRLLDELPKLPELKYIDITDEQMKDDYHGSLDYVRAAFETPRHKLPLERSARLTYIEHLARNHPLNQSRKTLAYQMFDYFPRLRRVCFVRFLVGELYLRHYNHAVADSTGYISDKIKDTDLAELPKSWRYGVPQTDLMPFPSFTPWEGFE